MENGDTVGATRMEDDGGLGMLADELLRKLSAEMGDCPIGNDRAAIRGWMAQINEWIRKSDEFDYPKGR